MKFGHHQSFYLRVNWLSKAMKMRNEDPEFFYNEFGFEKIGLGKNMVKSLRYWVVATSVMEERKNEERKSIHQLTEFGRLVFEHDRFIRLPLTAAVLHCILASNKEQASTWYWYFNEFNHRSGTNDEVLATLSEWVKQHHNREVSTNTLKRDLDCLKLMYSVQAKSEDDPEEVVASPLSGLNLLYETKDQFVKQSPEIHQIDLDALYFNLLFYCGNHGVNSVTLEEILVKPMLWGKLYHLSSNQILEALELLHADTLYPVKFVRTNQIYSLNVEVEDAYAFLRKAYLRKAVY